MAEYFNTTAILSTLQKDGNLSNVLLMFESNYKKILEVAKQHPKVDSVFEELAIEFSKQQNRIVI